MATPSGPIAPPIALSIVIPAFDESARLPETLRSALAFLDGDGRGAEIVVVDDGSTDDTAARAEELARADPRVRVVRLPRNLGKGAAVRAGVLASTGARVLFTDADGSFPFDQVRRLDAALDAGADIAVGSRTVRGWDTAVETHPVRKVVGRVFRALVRSLAHAGVEDTQCGFKLLDGAAARDVFPRLRMRGYSFDVEMLVIAARRGYRVTEVAVTCTHHAGSKVRIVRDGARMARDVVLIRLNAARGVYDEPTPPDPALLSPRST